MLFKDSKLGNKRNTHTKPGEDDSYYLGTVSKTGTEDIETWFVKLNVEGSRVNFLINTGADITVINEETFNSLGNKVKLSKTLTRYESPDGRINCLG